MFLISKTFIRLTLCSATFLSPYASCAGSIFDQVGQQEHVRPDILWAMALQESGSPYSNNPWPWTANINGRAFYFKTKQKAVSHVAKALKQGAMVDVGLMQVNLNYHGDKFESIGQAFNPVVNLTVAARILKKYSRYPLWEAVGKYHCPSNVDWCQRKAYQYAISVRKRLLSYETQ